MKKNTKRTVTIRLNISDEDGNCFKNPNDFVVDIPSGVRGKKNEFNVFKGAIINAVTEWFRQDREAVLEYVENFGCCSRVKSVQDCIKHFPAFCVAHIPADIMERNGFRLVPGPSIEKEFISCDGFLCKD